MKHYRICSFCNFTADYDSFPEDSVVAAGICACADCLQSDTTKDFREALEIEVLIYGEATV